jgi:hypothetical protein
MPLLRDFRHEKGGWNPVDGWKPLEFDSFGDYIRAAFDEKTSIHSSFDSTYEALDFMRATGDYTDKNSFFYSEQDYLELQEEGFFQSMQCPSCLEDLKTQLEGDSIPEEDIINPQLVSGKTENQVTSYKPDQDKFIEKTWYICRDHPEVHITKEESYYE